MNSKISYSITECPSTDILEKEWQDLEAQTDCNFFLSWGWIGNWLRKSPQPPALFRAQSEGKTIGLAVLGYAPGKNPNYQLNESGFPEIDSLYIEYNGILCIKEPMDLERSCLGWIAQQIQKLDINRLRPETSQALSQTAPFRLIDKSKAPWLNLTNLKKEQKTILTGLSRNSRQQIRRAIRLHSKNGELSLGHAATSEEALDMLDQLRSLHQASWNARGKPGAFANNSFTEFHRELIKHRFPHGETELLSVTGQHGLIGILYHFCYRGEALSYQSGFSPVRSKHDKPGLICHVLAAQNYLDRNYRAYRFLCGDSQYKRSLSNRSDRLYSYSTRPLTVKERLKAMITPNDARDEVQ